MEYIARAVCCARRGGTPNDSPEQLLIQQGLTLRAPVLTTTPMESMSTCRASSELLHISTDPKDSMPKDSCPRRPLKTLKKRFLPELLLS
jgi:hypothetical protein